MNVEPSSNNSQQYLRAYFVTGSMPSISFVSSSFSAQFYQAKAYHCHPCITEEESKAQRNYRLRAIQILRWWWDSNPGISTPEPIPLTIILYWHHLCFGGRRWIIQSIDRFVDRKTTQNFVCMLWWHWCLSWSSKLTTTKFMWPSHLLQTHCIYCFLIKAPSMIEIEDT